MRFNTWGSTRFAGAEASLLWYKDMFDNGRQALQYQALVQFVEVTQNGNWSEAFRILDWSFGFRRATTRCSKSSTHISAMIRHCSKCVAAGCC